MKTLILAFFLSLFAPACLVHHHDHHPDTRRGAYVQGRRCHPSHYWNGHHCVKKGHGHHKHKHKHKHKHD